MESLERLKQAIASSVSSPEAREAFVDAILEGRAEDQVLQVFSESHARWASQNDWKAWDVRDLMLDFQAVHQWAVGVPVVPADLEPRSRVREMVVHLMCHLHERALALRFLSFLYGCNPGDLPPFEEVKAEIEFIAGIVERVRRMFVANSDSWEDREIVRALWSAGYSREQTYSVLMIVFDELNERDDWGESNQGDLFTGFLDALTGWSHRSCWLWPDDLPPAETE
jgi:hypothetical protein